MVYIKVQSEQDFQEKMARGGGYPHAPKDMTFFNQVNADATENCTALLDWQMQHTLLSGSGAAAAVM